MRSFSQLFNDFGQDLKYALRGLRQSPGFAAAVIITLALGIGANVAMFGVVDRLMFRPYPYLKDPSTVHRVYLRQTDVRGTTRTQADEFQYTRYTDIRNGTSSFTHQAAFLSPSLAVGVGDAARERRVGVVSAANPGDCRKPRESLLDTYHAERHPVGARVLRSTMAQVALMRVDDRIDALRETISELLSMDEPHKRFAARMSGLDIHYDLGAGHPLLGRRMPDLDLVTTNGPLRVFTLLHDARPVLINFGEPGAFDITPWSDRVQLVDATYDGTWELPAIGVVTTPTAVLIRPDGYVAWVGEGTQNGLEAALTTWFGPPTVT